MLQSVLIAVGLAMDAFAVSIGAAAANRITGARATFRLSFHFGLFQFLMPIVGWFAGDKVAPYIGTLDHWIAFGLLLYVGGHMVYAGVKGGSDDLAPNPSRGWTLVMLSVATSIDALAVGFTLGVLSTTIWTQAAIIGLVTGVMSFIGIRAGRRLGTAIGPVMEVVGGLALVGIGLRILLAHLGG